MTKTNQPNHIDYHFVLDHAWDSFLGYLLHDSECLIWVRDVSNKNSKVNHRSKRSSYQSWHLFGVWCFVSKAELPMHCNSIKVWPPISCLPCSKKGCSQLWKYWTRFFFGSGNRATCSYSQNMVKRGMDWGWATHTMSDVASVTEVTRKGLPLDRNYLHWILRVIYLVCVDNLKFERPLSKRGVETSNFFWGMVSRESTMNSSIEFLWNIWKSKLPITFAWPP